MSGWSNGDHSSRKAFARMDDTRAQRQSPAGLDVQSVASTARTQLTTPGLGYTARRERQNARAAAQPASDLRGGKRRVRARAPCIRVFAVAIAVHMATA